MVSETFSIKIQMTSKHEPPKILRQYITNLVTHSLLRSEFLYEFLNCCIIFQHDLQKKHSRDFALHINSNDF